MDSNCVPDGNSSSANKVHDRGCVPAATECHTTVDGVSNHRYNMENRRRGEFIIINNKTFGSGTGMNVRKGTDVDEQALSDDFRSLGFHVTVHKDRTAYEMLAIMLKASEASHSDCDCFGVAVLSHGDNTVLYGVDKIIAVENFIDPIKRCASLAGKPKIFIFQACRGNELDPGVKVHADGDPYGATIQARRIPMEADFLYAYSTVPGYYSWRNEAKGSWFVQALHKMMNEYALKMEFVRLLTRVNHEVAYEFESKSDEAYLRGMKQIPSIVSMLTKDLFFTKKTAAD